MNNTPGALIKNISAAFEASPAEALDRKWLQTAVEEIKKVYDLEKKNDNPFSLPLPWETKAEIKALKKAQTILAKGSDKENNKPLIEGLEQKIARLSTRLLWTKKPRGHQINFVLDASVYSLAELIKAKTGAYDWKLLSDLISKHLKEMSPHQALKAHKRFGALHKDKEKYRLAVIANAKFLITKEGVKQKIKEIQESRIPQ